MSEGAILPYSDAQISQRARALSARYYPYKPERGAESVRDQVRFEDGYLAGFKDGAVWGCPDERAEQKDSTTGAAGDTERPSRLDPPPPQSPTGASAGLPCGERDWTEDYADEDNGCYGHLCTVCGLEYYGHKRRYATCKLCSTNLRQGNAIIAMLRRIDSGTDLDADQVANLLLRISVLEKAEQSAIELQIKAFAAEQDRRKQPEAQLSLKQREMAWRAAGAAMNHAGIMSKQNERTPWYGAAMNIYKILCSAIDYPPGSRVPPAAETDAEPPCGRCGKRWESWEHAEANPESHDPVNGTSAGTDYPGYNAARTIASYPHISDVHNRDQVGELLEAAHEVANALHERATTEQAKDVPANNRDAAMTPPILGGDHGAEPSSIPAQRTSPRAEAGTSAGPLTDEAIEAEAVRLYGMPSTNFRVGAHFARRALQAKAAVTDAALHDASVEHVGDHVGTRSAWSFRQGALWFARQVGATVTP